MSQLRWPRLLWAGLVAGLILVAGEAVLNGLLLGPEWEQFLFERKLQIGPVAGGSMLLLTLLLGLLLAWLTVILRRKDGPSLRPVLEAALTVWGTVYLYTSLWLGLLDLLPWRPLVFGIIWGIGETILASLAASLAYGRGRK